MSESFDVVPTHLVIKAMQDSGYRNAAYALAELIDNAIQAGATDVQLICVEDEEFVRERTRSRIAAIAVLDNGTGMSAAELRRALQFGNGAHLNDRDGIGRFGMGLPNSSFSQGERVDVWTWQAGPDSAVHSFLDLAEIAASRMREVPVPSSSSPPPEWVARARTRLGKTGTLVVWPRPTRCTWRTSGAVIRNSEDVVGRIYRRFISSGQVTIRMAAFVRAAEKPEIDIDTRPNDPMYLLTETTCPAPWDKTPMFEPWGDKPEQEIKVKFRGKVETVRIRYSFAKKAAREGHNPGERPHGKHAARNVGVSIVRANRELELDTKWLPGYDPVTRWMGIEVDFPPALDEVFGVTNNKQSATTLADMAGMDKEQLAERHGFGSYQELKAAWAEDGDPREPLLQVRDAIDSASHALLNWLKAQTRGQKGGKRHPDKSTPEAKATEATAQRKKDGHVGTSDAGENAPSEQRKQEIEEELAAEGVEEARAHDLAGQTIDNGLKYVFAHAESTSGAFFSVKPKGGAIVITLNTAHPAYDHLVAVLEDAEDEGDLEKLQLRQAKALDGLKLLLTAWARYEDEEPDGQRRIQVQESREDWGRVARQFLRQKG
ncbi:MAG: ATP-binding protein [Polyangiaceae bacterium]|nr:ATP-binding protein [Polyangiaceae bacterium]